MINAKDYQNEISDLNSKHANLMKLNIHFHYLTVIDNLKQIIKLQEKNIKELNK